MIPAGTYVWSDERERVSIPEWLPSALPKKAVGRQKARPGFAVADERDLKEAAKWLHSSKPAFDREHGVNPRGKDGDSFTVFTINCLGDRGASAEGAYDLMLNAKDPKTGLTWNERCEPSWEPEALWKKVKSAHASRQNDIGCKVTDKLSKRPHAFHEVEKPAYVAELNERYAVVKYGTKVMIAVTPPNAATEFMDQDHFMRLLANRHITVNDKKIPVAKAWLAHPQRRQYVDPGVVFEPGKSDVGPGALNLWRGFGVESRPGDWSLMQTHIREVICAGDQVRFDWLLGWMTLGAQRLDRPLGVVVALQGVQGCGKGVFARAYGTLFGDHFQHISQEGQLVGRFNAHLGRSVCVFLDECLFAGNRQHEGILKALITEPTLAIEAKFQDLITVPNRLRLIVASNEDWMVPVGLGDRRFAVFDVLPTYAGPRHADYWDALHAELNAGGREAMLFDLLFASVSGFDVQNIPNTAAKTDQKLRHLRGTDRWLYTVLADGMISRHGTAWGDEGCEVSKDTAYRLFEDHCASQRDYRPPIKELWAKRLIEILSPHVQTVRRRVGEARPWCFVFGPLAECRARFANHIGDPDMQWVVQDG